MAQIAHSHTVHSPPVHARRNTYGSPTYQLSDNQSPDPLRDPPPWRRKYIEQLVNTMTLKIDSPTQVV